MPIPKKLDKSPIIEAIAELRVEKSVSVPVVYSILNDIFDEGIEELPILQLPQSIRDSDPGLRYKPTHKFKSTSNFYLNVGPYVFGFGHVSDADRNLSYPGWTEYYTQFKKVYERLKSKDLLKNTTRVGLRYINLFQEDDFLDKLRTHFDTSMLEGGSVEDVNIGFVVRDNSYATRVIINTSATVNVNNLSKNGQILDIDSFTNDEVITNPLATTKSLHKNARDIFFASLTESYINELGPTYADK